jgi:acyl carrier protein
MILIAKTLRSHHPNYFLDLKKYLQIIKDLIPSFEEQQLNVPVKDAGIDSIDMVVIRVAIEKYFKLEVSDKEWYAFSTYPSG